MIPAVAIDWLAIDWLAIDWLAIDWLAIDWLTLHFTRWSVWTLYLYSGQHACLLFCLHAEDLVYR
jgi:hypothetical protein